MKSKSKSVLFALLLLTVTPVFANEREKLVQELERTREKFLKSVEGLSEAQWNYKTSPEKWSIAQCAEHIAASESLIRGAVVKAIAEPLPADAKDLVKDEMVQKFMVDRSKKFNAPEPLVPSDRYGSPAAAVDAFRTERAETLKLAQSDAEMRKHALEHPGFGMLDAYGWMLFLSTHTERHTLQIEEVKANADFPK
ncbi:MAG TPA: DinB family protein [Thermoanaerobaculia bacterium]|nr:DinB family protein [Thermoanaerobaculia bacterium]